MVRRPLFLTLMALFVAGCGSESSSEPGSAGGAAGVSGSGTGGSAGTAGTGGGSAGAGGQSGSEGGTGGGGNFDPDDPGIHVSFTLGVSLLMGQPTTVAAGVIMNTGREDLETPANTPKVPIETCEVGGAVYVSSCSGPEDCAPEQDCIPRTWSDGSPIANSERCVTPRTAMDVGEFTMDGFATGTKTFAYNEGQNGAYTLPGSDGTLPYVDLAFDATYSFQGQGDAAQGLGPFSGEFYLSPEFVMTQPPMTPLAPMNVPGIEASVSEDLVLVWEGSNPGAEINITLTGASTSGESSTIRCRTMDAGTFTIPAAMVEAAQLGDMAFFNMLTFERTDTGTVTGEGITSHNIVVMQTAVINVAKLP
jgi:hypothetical protein